MKAEMIHIQEEMLDDKVEMNNKISEMINEQEEM
jgi:hypothetical protein